MQQIGVVRELCGELALVEVSRKSACEGCHANTDGSCSACVSFGDKKMSAKATNKLGAKVGDRVVIETASGTVITYAAAVFLFPILLAILGYLLGTCFSFDAAPYVFAVTGFAAAFAIVWATLDRRAKKRCDVRIIRIL